VPVPASDGDASTDTHPSRAGLRKTKSDGRQSVAAAIDTGSGRQFFDAQTVRALFPPSSRPETHSPEVEEAVLARRPPVRALHRRVSRQPRSDPVPIAKERDQSANTSTSSFDAVAVLNPVEPAATPSRLIAGDQRIGFGLQAEPTYPFEAIV
jgi:hypothetical protein